MESIELFKYGASPTFSTLNIYKVMVRPAKYTNSKIGSPVGYSQEVVFNGYQHIPVKEYLQYNNDRHLLVLTNKELRELSGIAFRHGVEVKIQALENTFPVLKSVRNVDRACNYFEMKRILKLLVYLGYGKERLATQLRRKLHKRALRKIRVKSSLDKAFRFLPDGTISEPYVMLEPRPNRLIYALDFNSMYPSCMLEKFSNPGKLAYSKEKISITRDNIVSKNLKSGVYIVKLINPESEFIKIYSPFKLSFLKTGYPIELSSGNSYKLVLNLDEINFYINHFEKIVIIESVTSESNIDHPLKATVRDLYKKRVDSKGVLSRLKKFELSILHSMTRQKKKLIKQVNKKSFLATLLESHFQIGSEKSLKMIEFLGFESILNILNTENSYFGSTFNIEDFVQSSSVESLYFETLSKARVKLLSAMQDIYNLAYGEICYANVDSIHVSIPACRKCDFEYFLSSIVGNDIGQLKIEAVGKKGFWLGPGRYWITNENEVVKFSNSYFNHNGASSSFISFRARQHLSNYLGMRWIDSVPIKLQSTIYAKKFIKADVEKGLIRFKKFKGKTFEEAHELLINEKYNNKTIRNFIIKELAIKLQGLGGGVPK